MDRPRLEHKDLIGSHAVILADERKLKLYAELRVGKDGFSWWFVVSRRKRHEYVRNGFTWEQVEATQNIATAIRAFNETEVS